MATQEYECPACGGVMEFDAPSQKLKCLYCDTTISVDEYHKMVSKGKAEKAADSEEKSDRLSDEEAENYGFGKDKNVYICKSCGGEIIADKTQGATQCPFCGNNVTFKEVFTNGRRPDYVIPFQLTKEQAKQKYKDYIKGRKLLPKAFSTENHIDEIKGVYIPYWLFDANMHVSLNCEATKVRTWSDRDYRYTETSFYDVYREGDVPFSKVPVDGSSKMPDDLTESIEPYDDKGLKKYDDAYFAGYVANQYDVDEEKSRPRAKQRMTNSAVNEIKNSVQGYSSVMVRNQNVATTSEACKYALYPVWLLSTTWNGQNFLFAMNGQTGKFVGNLPVDKGAAFKYFALSSVLFTVLFAVLELIFRI
ncbi:MULTISPECIES: hypothetical protein [Butyrivibrio]|jgi:DNA-directed RNA polymerase subunit RPC12/RpoP|uniref:hypothetical protein n=1 Tax=Butyrivibrio TaxID=830 RepID=UPI0003FF080B|nr:MULTISPECIES: hypothetical protein [Butyrivibrio]SEQ08797.1 hypothetical protein SAMN02910382_01967 [Butyrivibrio sp. TB]